MNADYKQSVMRSLGLRTDEQFERVEVLRSAAMERKQLPDGLNWYIECVARCLGSLSLDPLFDIIAAWVKQGEPERGTQGLLYPFWPTPRKVNPAHEDSAQ